MHTTSRLGLDVVDTTDNVSDFPTVDAQAKGILDSAVIYAEGTLASKPSASIKGRIYKATDTGVYYWDTGSVWQPLLIAGAWTNLTLGTDITTTSGGFTPAARLIGDMVLLRGQLHNGSGGDAVDAATLPSGFRPSNTINVTGVLAGAPAPLEIATSTGTINVVGSFTNNFNLSLDGIFFSIA